MEKNGFKIYGEDCDDWLVSEMLESETYMQHFFQNRIEMKLDIKLNLYERKHLLYRERELKIQDENEKPVFKDHRPLMGN